MLTQIKKAGGGYPAKPAPAGVKEPPRSINRQSLNEIAQLLAPDLNRIVAAAVEEALRSRLDAAVAHAFEQAEQSLSAALRKSVTDVVLGLTGNSIPEFPVEDDPPRVRTEAASVMLAEARALGETYVASLKDDPSMLSAEDFAKRLGVTSPTVHNWRRDGRVIGLTQAGRKMWFPDIQIGPNGELLSGLAELMTAVHDEWAAYRFLRARLAEFGGMTGAAALAQDSEKAVAIARKISDPYPHG